MHLLETDGTHLRKSNDRTAGGVYSPAWARGGIASALSLEVNYYRVALKNAIDSVPGTLTLNRCAFLGDAVSCANITRASNGDVTGINGTLQNLNAINTEGLDGTFTYRSTAIRGGTIGLTANAAYLLKYDVNPPAALNAPTQHCVGTERCLATDQAFPRFKLNSTLDWSSIPFGASFTARYISAVYENDGHRMEAAFYGDVQFYFSPSWMDHKVRLTAGVNNVFNTAPPACDTCDSANFDPTTYDLPGQFGYARLSYAF